MMMHHQWTDNATGDLIWKLVKVCLVFSRQTDRPDTSSTLCLGVFGAFLSCTL